MGDLNETSFLALNASVDASPLTVALAIGAAKYLVLVIPALLLIGWLGGGARQRFVALALQLRSVFGLERGALNPSLAM